MLTGEKMGDEKLFYTIGEASQLIDVKPYVLRYWETEFKQLNPRKSETGQRVYRTKDIQISQTIKRLLYVEKYTIAGAKQKLEELEKNGFDSPPISPEHPTSGKSDSSSPPTPVPIQIEREKSFEFRTLLSDIRKILKKYNLA
jgi:DNA-binding transcriptional MerR regulator